MALRIVCMCGYVIQGDHDDELWTNAQGHMGVLHPELVGNVTREDNERLIEETFKQSEARRPS